jgi:uncharacterized protein YoxC
MTPKNSTTLERVSQKMTNAIGTTDSLVVHTVLFVGIFTLGFLGVSVDQILLVLTTIVSLEAIYLAIFIQMTVNRTTASLASVEEDIDDIQEDVDDIQEDVDSLESNIKEISDDYIDDSDEVQVVQALKSIETSLKDLQKDIQVLKKKGLL